MDDPFWGGGVDATNRVSKIHLENPAKTTLRHDILNYTLFKCSNGLPVRRRGELSFAQHTPGLNPYSNGLPSRGRVPRGA
jgi:hypothetical protein